MTSKTSPLFARTSPISLPRGFVCAGKNDPHPRGTPLSIFWLVIRYSKHTISIPKARTLPLAHSLAVVYVYRESPRDPHCAQATNSRSPIEQPGRRTSHEVCAGIGNCSLDPFLSDPLPRARIERFHWQRRAACPGAFSSSPSCGTSCKRELHGLPIDGHAGICCRRHVPY